jgi:hypothetical protein
MVKPYEIAPDENDNDVVLSTLREKRNLLWKMTESNMISEFTGMGIMDDIRLEQIDQLDKAMKLWQSREAIREVIRISDREHDAWKEVKDAI